MKSSLITLDPGHFHASWYKSSCIRVVKPVVHVYAPHGDDLNAHLKRIQDFNARAETPTHWQEKVYTGPDFLPNGWCGKRRANVVVIAGNNTRKTQYIDVDVERA